MVEECYICDNVFDVCPTNCLLINVNLTNLLMHDAAKFLLLVSDSYSITACMISISCDLYQFVLIYAIEARYTKTFASEQLQGIAYNNNSLTLVGIVITIMQWMSVLHCRSFETRIHRTHMTTHNTTLQLCVYRNDNPIQHNWENIVGNA